MAKIIEVEVWETLIWLPWVTVSERRPEAGGGEGRNNLVIFTPNVDTALEILKAQGEDAYVIGEIIAGDDGVVFC